MKCLKMGYFKIEYATFYSSSEAAQLCLRRSDDWRGVLQTVSDLHEGSQAAGPAFGPAGVVRLPPLQQPHSSAAHRFVLLQFGKSNFNSV